MSLLFCMVLNAYADGLKSDAQLESIRSTANQFPQFKFLEIKLEDAFDKEWWLNLTGRSDGGLSSHYIDHGK